MAFYQDAGGNLYWHDRIAAVLAPVPPSPMRAAQGIWPSIARIRPQRAGWLQPGSLVLMAAGLAMAGLSIPLAQHDWPLGLALSALGFLWTAWSALFFVQGLCAARVRFEQTLTLAPFQPWAPYLLPLATILSLAGPTYALFWAPQLEAMQGAGRAVLPLLLLTWLVWRRFRRWRHTRRLLRQALAEADPTIAATSPPTP